MFHAAEVGQFDSLLMASHIGANPTLLLYAAPID
jgi:hypothetical protein